MNMEVSMLMRYRFYTDRTRENDTVMTNSSSPSDFIKHQLVFLVGI